MILIAKNTTVTDILLEDLFGLTIPASGQLILTDRVDDYALITDSQDLETHVTSGDIVLNNGIIDLSASDGINTLQFPTFYDLSELVDIDTSGTFKDIVITFGHYNKHYFKFEEHSWTLAAHLIFGGTNRLGSPKEISVSAYTKHAHEEDDADGYVRLYDTTNNNVVAEWEVRGPDAIIYTDTTPINLPTGQALFEVQGKKGECGHMYLTSLLIKF